VTSLLDRPITAASDDDVACVALVQCCHVCVTQDIPSTGLDVWAELRARSERSKVEGQLHLRLSLATREERDLPEDERQFETKQHCDLISIFIDHELRKAKVTNQRRPNRILRINIPMLYKKNLLVTVFRLFNFLCLIIFNFYLLLMTSIHVYFARYLLSELRLSTYFINDYVCTHVCSL